MSFPERFRQSCFLDTDGGFFMGLMLVTMDMLRAGRGKFSISSNGVAGQRQPIPGNLSRISCHVLMLLKHLKTV